MTEEPGAFNEFEELGSFEDKVDDIDPDKVSDFKMNPDYLVFKALMAAQYILVNTHIPFNERIHNYWVCVDHIEVLIDAAGRLPNDYEKQINEYTSSSEYVNAGDVSKPDNISIRQIKMLCQFKMRILTKQIFRSKALTEPMKI